MLYSNNLHNSSAIRTGPRAKVCGWTAQWGGTHVLHAELITLMVTHTLKDGALFLWERFLMANGFFLRFKVWLNNALPTLSTSTLVFSGYFLSPRIAITFFSYSQDLKASLSHPPTFPHSLIYISLPFSYTRHSPTTWIRSSHILPF